jgi:Flp pilus assembly pilin Flp
MRTLNGRLRADDSGQDLVEYAMLMAFISLVCIVALQSLGTAINTTYGSVSTSLVSSLAAGS